MPETPDKLTYPRRWEYTVIGWRAESVREAIAEVFVGLEHVVADANTSRAGTYCSVRVETTVHDEAHRNALFAALAGHEAVKMVL